MKKSQKQINDDQATINEAVSKHLEIANTEMGIIKNDVAWIKSSIENLANKQWWTIGIIVTSILSGFITKLLGK